jgi:hypothetical protein
MDPDSTTSTCLSTFVTSDRNLMVNAMRADYSWNGPGQHDINVFEHIRHK